MLLHGMGGSHQSHLNVGPHGFEYVETDGIYDSVVVVRLRSARRGVSGGTTTATAGCDKKHQLRDQTTVAAQEHRQRGQDNVFVEAKE